MSLSLEEVQKVARLARLKLTPQEQASFAGQLSQILGYAELLNNLDTTGVPPMCHAEDLVNVFRADDPAPSLDRREALLNAPKSDGKYFLVPQILEGA